MSKASHRGVRTNTHTSNRQLLRRLAVLGAATIGFAADLAHAQTSASWTFDGNSSWSINSNWTPAAFPTGSGAATFGATLTAARTVTLDLAVNLGTINFTNGSTTNTYTIAGANTLTLSGPAIINV